MFNRQQNLSFLALSAILVGLMIAFAAIDINPQIGGTIIVALAVFGVAFSATAGPPDDIDA